MRFMGRGISVAGGAALDDIRYVYIQAALQAECRQHIVQQLSRLPDKWLARHILLFSWPFADAEPVGISVAHSEHGASTRLA